MNVNYHHRERLASVCLFNRQTFYVMLCTSQLYSVICHYLGVTKVVRHLGVNLFIGPLWQCLFELFTVGLYESEVEMDVLIP